MQKINLYKYEDGGFVTVTPNKRNEADTPNLMRLIADENCTLTNGITEIEVIDVMLDKVDLWTETIKEPSLEQKAHAYDILTGVIE